MAVTAKRENMRLIAIVLGEEDSKTRNNETMELLNYGFDNYKIDLLKKNGEVIDTIKVDKGTKDRFDVVLSDDLTILTKKSNPEIKYDYKIVLDEITLPIKKGDIVGKYYLLNNNSEIKSVDLIVNDDISKVNYFKYLFKLFVSVI